MSTNSIQMFFSGLIIFSALSFIIYGVTCLFSKDMREEFKRFDLEKYWLLTGILELLGGAGMLVGFLYQIAGLVSFSASGLSLLMLFGIGFRIRAKDRWIYILPATLFMVLNFAISVLVLL
ncbi:MAG: DoxX family protein [Cyclonatronaceae bacterium]